MADKHDHLHHDGEVCEECEEFDTITLTDEDGEEHEFLHLDTLEVDGGTYFVLISVADDDLEEDEAIILKLGFDEAGSEMLLDIEDDEEWEKVADAWNSLEDDDE
ncbi:MAG: DUF1292 domain-containing protein [Peptococcaceae bacterium]|jgi:uncharacterized protein YrzB (UPF0473 family)|nr:DUF1292 domain-containing protein [Peptococcaceae bacterium]